MKYIIKIILSFPRYIKQMIAIITDINLCILCTWLAMIIIKNEIVFFNYYNFYPALISFIIAIPIFWSFGLYRIIFRYSDISIILNIFTSTFLYGLLYSFVIWVHNMPIIPKSIGVLQPMVLFFAIVGSRLLVKFVLISNYYLKENITKENVLVYGTGDAGRQLVSSLENSPEYKVIGFLDDNPYFNKQSLLGKTVYFPENIEKLIQLKEVRLVFLALPSISRKARNDIIERLNKFKLRVKTLPTISDLLNNKITVSDVLDLNIYDLLNREEVKPYSNLLNKNIYSKTVLVTGAGGSIGSELCRQIIRLKPNKLILLELNEFALYKIYEELLVFNQNLNIIPLLVNVQDRIKLEFIFESFKVSTVYHTAAYKHVTLVEENICEGITNNVFSTLAVAKASISKKVENFVLISSDKAVRPTNVMGASKRLSELCVQGIYNNTRDITTNFSIVRFGNVLLSSGSVIPKFKKQIKEGGPVTLTHQDVTRYFMTVTEAAQLVIQAGAMGEKSEVFVLEMGEIVKIKDLVYKMINLSGFTVKDDKNPNGDIQVKVIGLKPGEKLYEELLIGDNPQKTSHPKILKAQDPFIPYDQLKQSIADLRVLCKENKIAEVKIMIEKLIPSYRSNSKIVDHIYRENSNFRDNLKITSKKESKVNNIINIKTK